MKMKTILRSLKANPLSYTEIRNATTEDLQYVYCVIDMRSWSISPMSMQTDRYYAETRIKLRKELRHRGI